MLRIVVAALALAAAAHAQDLDFNGINTGRTAAPQVAALTPPPDPSSGQGAPYWGFNQYEYGTWNHGYYNRYNQLKNRYDNVRARAKQVRGWYPSRSYQRMQIDQSLDMGEAIWKQYKRYQDPNSAWQLELWCQQWEQYLAQVGYQRGGWYTHYDYNYNRDYGYRYRYPEYGYYDNYQNWYYGGNQYYTNGLLLGNSIGHIVNGARYDNDLQLAGGVLGTIGNSINLFNYPGY